MKEALTYDDVLLTPQYSDIKSRKEVGRKVKLQYQADINTGERYQVVNLQNSATIEVRCFKGNLSEIGFRKNLDFVESMFYFCKDAGLNDLNVENYIAYVKRDAKTYKHLNSHFKRNAISLDLVLENPNTINQ